jgi:hypothetical protein
MVKGEAIFSLVKENFLSWEKAFKQQVNNTIVENKYLYNLIFLKVKTTFNSLNYNSYAT